MRDKIVVVGTDHVHLMKRTYNTCMQCVATGKRGEGAKTSSKFTTQTSTHSLFRVVLWRHTEGTHTSSWFLTPPTAPLVISKQTDASIHQTGNHVHVHEFFVLLIMTLAKVWARCSRLSPRPSSSLPHFSLPFHGNSIFCLFCPSSAHIYIHIHTYCLFLLSFAPQLTHVHRVVCLCRVRSRTAGVHPAKGE